MLGSLATFVVPISGLLGQQDGKHMVATITVYFHPARSIGSMFQALICASVAFIYAAFICITSMAVSVLFTDKLDAMVLGHIIVLVVFCGGGLGLVGWTKQRLGDPLVNVACSLTSLAIITVLTKEGAVQAGDFSFAKIGQVLKMILMGVVATMVVSFLILPTSARSKLRKNTINVTDTLADMLAILSNSFLTGGEDETERKEFQNVSERHRKTFGTLGQNLKEAKYEHYVFGTEKEYHIEARLVQCIQRISQSIGGLRSAATMQFIIIQQQMSESGRKDLRMNSIGSIFSLSTYGPPKRVHSADLTASPLPVISETPDEDDAGSEVMNGDRERSTSVATGMSTFKTPAEIFSLFIDNLGPSMRSLAYTLKEILDELPYGPAPKFDIKVNPKFRSSLDRAIELYTTSRDESLKAVYQKKEMDSTRSLEVEADWEEAAASCGHFSFCLLEVAEQVKEYLVILDELQLELEEHPAGTRTWQWLKFWSPRESHAEESTSDELAHAPDNLDLEVTFPKPTARANIDMYSQHGHSTTHSNISQRVYHALAFFRRDDIRFAIKVGLGAALYALPSYIPSTQPFYAHWRGEWGLLSYMLVCSMTIGASNTTGYSRFLGTFIGAICAIIAWHLSGSSPYTLCLLGFVMAYWTAYIIVAQGKGPMGRYIMLTYNLSALYAYSLSIADETGDEDELHNNQPLILEITLHRVLAVLSGCIWGLIITRLIWPISARTKLKSGLSLLWLRMGLIWKRDPLSIFLSTHPPPSGNPTHYLTAREEASLATSLATLQSLRESARSEFELRGPFPNETYTRLLAATARMLDAFHTMSTTILKDLHASPGEAALLHATARERAQLCARCAHLLHGAGFQHESSSARWTARCRTRSTRGTGCWRGFLALEGKRRSGRGRGTRISGCCMRMRW